MWLKTLPLVLEKHCALVPQSPLLLGLSGGPDSLSLMHALHALGWVLHVAHLDHALRPNSKADARQVHRIAEEMGLPFHAERVDVAAHARGHSQSLEEAAREIRYAFLFRLAAELGVQAVAVAHTADDQVETLLMHFLRGAGSAGLRGMPHRSLPNPWSTTLPLVRPLLGFWREEVLAYCEENALQPIADESNQDRRFFRNRLRHELIPILQQYNPRIKTALLQSSQILAAETGLLEGLARQAWHEIIRQSSPLHLAFGLSEFRSQPLALQRMLLRLAFSHLRPQGRDLDFEAVQRALHFALHPGSGAPADWLSGLYLLVEGNLLWLADWQAQLPVEGPQLEAGIQRPVEVPGSLNLGAGWQLSAEETPADEVYDHALQNRDPFQTWLDSEAVGERLILRARKNGDRFQPLGMEKGRMKLSDFMVNAKLPRRARAAWPLLAQGEEILWIPGYQLAHPYRLQTTTRQALHLRIARLSP